MSRNRSFRELLKFNDLTSRNTPLNEFRKVEKILINRYFFNSLGRNSDESNSSSFCVHGSGQENGNSKMIKNQIGSVCPNHQIDWLGHQYFEQLSRRVELYVVLRPLRLSLKYSRDKQL